MNSLEGKVALVTGGGAGIGLATAYAFARAGASVVMADNDAPRLESASEAIRSEGHRVLAVPCDVTNRGQVKAMVDQTVATYGRLDAAFNNAGVNCDGAPMLETEDDEFEAIVNVNLRGAWNCMKAELRQMMTQGEACARAPTLRGA